MITQSVLKRTFDYNPLTGLFTWRISNSNRVKVGSIAGYIKEFDSGKRYIYIRHNGKDYRAHRLAFLYMLGKIPIEVDHHDGNGINNKWSNLSKSSCKENPKNRRLQKNNTSGCVGVVWSKANNKWAAQIKVNYKNISLGYYTDIKEAIKYRKKAEEKYDFHKNHGQIRPL